MSEPSEEERKEEARFATEEYRVEYRRAYVESLPPRSFDEEQLARLDELEAAVAGEDAEALGLREEDRSRPVLARFLAARKFKVPKAAAMWRAAMEWRRDNGINALRENPPQRIMDAVRPHHPEVHRYKDKAGRPIYWWRFGAIDGQAIAKSMSQEQYLEYHAYLMEHGGALAAEAALEEHGEGVWSRQVCVVVDARGLSMAVRHFLPFFKPTGKMDADYYPETMGPIYVVNAPSVFGMVWRLVRPMLDPVTAAKVRVIGGNQRLGLLEHIDEDQLLEEYGGTAACPPEINLDGLAREALAAAERQGARRMDEEAIARGARFEHDVVVTAAECQAARERHADDPQVPVEYYFTTDGGDISFGAVFEPEGGGEPAVLVEPARCASHRHAVWGEFAVRVGGPGTVRLTWDNSYSWFTGKRLAYSITKPHNGVEDLDAAEPPSALRRREEDAGDDDGDDAAAAAE